MIPRKTLFSVCLVISALCLAVGFGFVRQWIGVAAGILTVPAWLLARKYPASWLPHICLLGSVGLAVVGRLFGSPFFLMICGSGVALAVWDILLFNSALGKYSSGEQTRQYESKHLQSLALALGSGLLVAFLGSFINLRIPFAVLLLFIALVVFGLDRVWGYIKKRANSK